MMRRRTRRKRRKKRRQMRRRMMRKNRKTKKKKKQKKLSFPKEFEPFASASASVVVAATVPKLVTSKLLNRHVGEQRTPSS
jgi:hypothetical protein